MKKQTEIYIYYLKGGVIHKGVHFDGKFIRQRPTIPSEQIDALVEITLNDSAPRTVASLYQIIDDGFKKIGTPNPQQLYGEATPLGVFRLLYRNSYPADARAAKDAIDKVLKSIPDHPFL